MKKLGCLFAAILIPVFVSVSAAVYDWSGGYKQIALDEGIISSDDISNTVNTDTYQITREYFCKLIYNAMNKKTGLVPSDNHIYTDTDSSEIAALSDIGIIKGKGGKKFFPEDTLTREEAATIIARAADIIGTGNYEQEVAVYNDDSGFSDWAKDSIYRVTYAGIMQGTGNEFLPKATYSKQEAITTVVRLYTSTPVEKENTEKTELMENVYVYKNSASTWIVDDGEIKICTNSFDGKYICGGVLSDGKRVVAVSQEKNHIASSKQIQIIDRACKVYDLSNGKRIMTKGQTAHKIFNDCLLSYSTDENEYSPLIYSEYSYTIRYIHSAYNLKTNEYIGEWYEFADGDNTIISTNDEIRLYRGNEQIKTIRGKLTAPGQNENEVPVFKRYFEVVTENSKEAYDRDGNLVYSYSDNVSYKACKDKFEFNALGNVREADSPHDEFTEELSENIDIVCAADNIRVMNDGNEVLKFNTPEIRDVMLMEDAGVLAVEYSRGEDKYIYDEDDIMLYNVSDGSKRAVLEKAGRLCAYHKNILFGDGCIYDTDGNRTEWDGRCFVDPDSEWRDNDKYYPKRDMEYYFTLDGLYRTEDYSLVVPGSFLAMDNNYIEMQNGDGEVIIYDYDGNVLLTTDVTLDYYEVNSGRKLLYGGLPAFDKSWRSGKRLRVYDYENLKSLVNAVRPSGSKLALLDNYAIIASQDRIGAVYDYEGNTVIEGGAMYYAKYNGEEYIIEHFGKLYNEGYKNVMRRADNLEIVSELSGEMLYELIASGPCKDNKGRYWYYNSETYELTATEP